jgi:DNA end-binding protein Ku
VAHQLIEALAADWEPQKYFDAFEANLKELIKARIEGREVPAVEKPRKMKAPTDLMSALKASLSQMEGKKKPAASAAAEPARKKKPKKAA